MTLEEIKLRRLAGQHLTDKSDAAAVLHDLCGIQAQMMSYAEHSLGIRCIDAPEYLDGFSAKSWTLRGTMHIFVLDDLPLFLHDGRTHYLREWKPAESTAAQIPAGTKRTGIGPGYED